MNPKQLLSEDDAVSPVIGVILMVAVTVILAAVIATAVIGLGSESAATTPQASFSYETVDTGNGTVNVTATHDGGDSLPLDQISVNADGAGEDPSDSDVTGSSVSAGDTWTAATYVSDGTTVRIVWNNPDTEDSVVISKFDVST